MSKKSIIAASLKKMPDDDILIHKPVSAYSGAQLLQGDVLFHHRQIGAGFILYEKLFRVGICHSRCNQYGAAITEADSYCGCETIKRRFYE